MNASVDNFFSAGSLVWPMTMLLIVLLVVRKVESDLHPVFSSIVSGVAQNAGSNATAYAIAIMFGLSASLSAFYDVFYALDAAAWKVISWHQYAALWTKVANPFCVAVLAYATQNKFTPPDPSKPK